MILPNIWENKIDVPNHQLAISIINPSEIEIVKPTEQMMVNEPWIPDEPRPARAPSIVAQSFGRSLSTAQPPVSQSQSTVVQ